MARTVELLDNRYDVFILPEARNKMELYCDLSSGEIGWLAFVERFETQGFLITDCVLLKQEVNGSTTEIDPNALLEFWNNTPVEKHNLIKMWGHSHVNMSPTPSGQDNEQMEYFKDGNPWFIRLITNKKREYHIDIFDYEHGIKVHIDQADLRTFNPSQDELRKSIEAEIKEKVSEKTYKTSTPTKSLPSPYQGSKNVYSSYSKSNKKSFKKNEPIEMLEEVSVKYVSSFEEVLNYPNYWKNIFAK